MRVATGAVSTQKPLDQDLSPERGVTEGVSMTVAAVQNQGDEVPPPLPAAFQAKQLEPALFIPSNVGDALWMCPRVRK